MKLRTRQEQFVTRACKALDEKKNTLGIGPTGSGKTVMLSAVAGRRGGTQAIIQHRDELVRQNHATFRKVNPRIQTSEFTADYKRFQKDGATFCMIQTLARNLDAIPFLDRIIVDEGHHAAANSYLQVIDAAKKKNPDLELALFTATPGRGDSRNMRSLVDNVCDQITLGELIRDGFLVPPRAFIIDTGNEGELGAVKKTINDFDMAAVERIMNKRVINEKVVAEWKAHASNRLTVVFTSTIEHARAMVEEFRRQGVSCDMVWADDPEREAKLAAFDRLEIQVMVNVAILVEGWDCQPVSCVILLRPCSHKSTMIQMIGRGLRTVDPERYPHVRKDDCIVLDFGYSLHTHRDLEQTIRLEAQVEPKECPSCQAAVPGALYECPICGYAWPKPETEPRAASDGGGDDDEEPILENFVLTEVDLFQRSPYLWEDLFDGIVTMANAMEAWACIVHSRGRWISVGGSKTTGMHLLADTETRLLALSAADDFMREHGDDDAAGKQAKWLHKPASAAQMNALNMTPLSCFGVSRYRAACMLTWKFNERGIQHKVLNRGLQRKAA